MKNDKSVKVYVCYYDAPLYHDLEFEPQRVFLSQEAAVEWCGDNAYGDYKELVLE